MDYEKTADRAIGEVEKAPTQEALVVAGGSAGG
jgi:hypothetical protein